MSRGLLEAAEEGVMWKVRYLLEHGLSIHSRNDRGEGLLVCVLRVKITKQRHKLFRWLLRQGADPRMVDKVTGRNVLGWAACLDRGDQMMLLVEEGNVSINHKDHHGYIALHYAVLHDNLTCVLLLCTASKKFGLTVDIPDGQGITPYLLACRLGHVRCTHILLKEGRASPYQFDTVNFNTSDSWQALGKKERQHCQQQVFERQLTWYKTLGRFPELSKANFDLNQVKMVKSKLEKCLLAPNESKSSPDTEGYVPPRGQQNPLPQLIAAGSRDTTSLPEAFGVLITELRREPTLRVGLPSISVPTQIPSTSVDYLGDTDDLEDDTILPDKDLKRSSKSSLSQMMGLLSDQTCHSYCDTVKRPPTPTGSFNITTAVKVSAFTMKLKKKAGLRKALKAVS